MSMSKLSKTLLKQFKTDLIGTSIENPIRFFAAFVPLEV